MKFKILSIACIILTISIVLVACKNKEEPAAGAGHGKEPSGSGETEQRHGGESAEKTAALDTGFGQISTEQGHYLLEAEFLTIPVKLGRNAMKLTIFDKESKKPVEKLDLEVVPWMPTHEHAGIGTPIIKENGNGEYQVENLNLTMMGDWEIYIRIKKGRSEDTAVYNVSVVSADR